MSGGDFRSLSPLLALALGVSSALLAIAIRRSHRTTRTVAFLSLVAALGCCGTALGTAPRQVTPLLIIDGYGLFFLGLILLAALAVLVFSADYLRDWRGQIEEYYPLLLLAVLGAGVLVLADHFAAFLLGLELLSVPLYALIAYRCRDQDSIEAGLKYLILAGVSTALLLLGMALIYAAAGTLQFSRLATAPGLTAAQPLWALGGLALILTGIGFKLALVPLHQWTPDVYQGAPYPITAFLATISKGAVLVLLLRYLLPLGGDSGPARTALSVLAIASMIAGNLLALRQENLKRLLGYSSIAHLGYLLVAVLAAGPMAITAVGFYLAAYFAATLTAFGVLSALSSAETEIQTITEVRALAWRRPWLGVPLLVALLSLAGIPLTAGFFAKFQILLAAVHANLWTPAIVLVLASVIGLYYYLRVLVALLAEPDSKPEVAPVPSAWSVTAGLAGLTVIMLWLGIWPTPLLALLEYLLGIKL